VPVSSGWDYELQYSGHSYRHHSLPSVLPLLLLPVEQVLSYQNPRDPPPLLSNVVDGDGLRHHCRHHKRDGGDIASATSHAAR